MSVFSTLLTCPLRIMFIASYPLKVRLAVLNEENPIPGLTNRLIDRWSCSILLFRYLTCRNSQSSANNSDFLSSSIAMGSVAKSDEGDGKVSQLCSRCSALHVYPASV